MVINLWNVQPELAKSNFKVIIRFVTQYHCTTLAMNEIKQVLSFEITNRLYVHYTKSYNTF